MKLLRTFARWLRRPEQNKVGDTLAYLILAARDDPAFRKRVLWVLALPAPHRESLVASAVREMRLRGEPESVCAAFAALATEDGAAVAARLISSA